MSKDAFEDALAQLTQAFRAGLKERKRALEEAKVQADAVRIKALAHRLSGTAGTFGLSELSLRARALEASPRDSAAWDALCSQLAIDAKEP